MDLIILVVLSVICGVLATELCAWTPRLSRFLTIVAASRMPKNKRELYAEQWLAELDNIPGAVSQLVFTFGLHIAVFGLKRVYGNQPQIISRIFGFIGIVLLSPLIILIICALRIEGKTPVFFRQPFKDLRGAKVKLVKFATLYSLDVESGAIRDKSGTVWRPSFTGNIIRKTGCHYLPFFYNVFCGDIAIVGPKIIWPEQFKEFVEILNEKNCTFSCRYGLISPSRVYDDFESLTDIEKIMVDLDYMRNRSLLSDLALSLDAFRKANKGASED